MSGQERITVENYGTVWVCQDCVLHHANGECGGCHEGHDRDPLSAIESPFTVAMGMAWDEHADECLRRSENDDAIPSDHDCDCETDTFSTSQCDGCGSHLHGERHAMTLFRD